MQKCEIEMLEYMSLVKYIARNMSKRLPANIEIDDLISAGLIGLMQAKEKFDPKRGHKFRTFAEFRIRGAMLDELRAQDWAPKAMRQKAKEFRSLCEKIQHEKGSPASDAELRAELKLSAVKYDRLVQHVHTLEMMNAAAYAQQRIGEEAMPVLIEQVVNENMAENPASSAEQHDIRHCIQVAMHRLTENEGQVLNLYYFEEMSLKEIGLKLRLSESRVSQIHTQAIANIKDYLSPELLAA